MFIRSARVCNQTEQHMLTNIDLSACGEPNAELLSLHRRYVCLFQRLGAFVQRELKCEVPNAKVTAILSINEKETKARSYS